MEESDLNTDMTSLSEELLPSQVDDVLTLRKLEEQIELIMKDSVEVLDHVEGLSED